jgi:sugar phosphate isomerase/epimerase
VGGQRNFPHNLPCQSPLPYQSHMFPEAFENHDLWTRRRLLKTAGTLTIGATLSKLAHARPDDPANRPRGTKTNEPKADAPIIQIGILLGTFGRPTLEGRLDAIKACGLDCVQISMDCAGMSDMPDKIAAQDAERIRQAAAERGIEIASLQGTFNMSHPDAAHRRAGVRRLAVLAEACKAVGTKKIHICTGTRDSGNMWRHHPDNRSPQAWRDMVACVRAAVKAIEPWGVTLGFEPEVNNVVDSAKKARQLMGEVGSPHLKVTMDAANLFHAGELPHMSEILDRAFELVGKDIVMAHAKDLSHDGDAGHEPAGHGKLDYSRYLSLLHQYGFKGPLLLHGLSEAQVSGCVAFLREKLAGVAAAKSGAKTRS